MSYLPNGKEFRDPQIFDMRSVAVERTDVNKKIINNRISLEEKPDYIHHIIISGFSEIFDEQIPPTETQFYCDYQNGMLIFNPLNEGLIIPNISYWGWGNILTPAERIYIHQPNPYAVDNLQGFVDLSTIKIAEINTSIGNANLATENAIVATNNANIATENAINATNDAITATENANAATENANLAATKANTATDNAEAALALLEEDRLNTRYIFKNPVYAFGDISAAYPTPEIGWRVQTLINGNIYRWDGGTWSFVENIQGAVLKATNDMDGLLSKEDFTKLQNIESNAQVNFTGEDAKNALPDYINTRTMVFVLPDEITDFSAGTIIQFPYEGEIVNVKAVCGTSGIGFTEISVDKISEADFISNNAWTSIFTTNLYFNDGQKVDDGTVTITDPILTTNNYFKVSLINIGTGIKDITIQINVKI